MNGKVKHKWLVGKDQVKLKHTKHETRFGEKLRIGGFMTVSPVFITVKQSSWFIIKEFPSTNIAQMIS